MRRGVALLALVLGVPALAQQQDAGEADLKALIPDDAVAHPDAWAKGATAPVTVFQAAGAPAPDAQTPPGKAMPGSEPASSVLVPAVAAPGQQPGAGDTSAPLTAASPLPDLSGLTLPWPDQAMQLPALAALPPDEGSATVLDLGGAAPSAAASVAAGSAPAHEDRLGAGHRLILVWPGAAIPERSAIEQRFRALSVTQPPLPRDAGSLAQISVRALADRELLERLLRTYGYYDGEVLQDVEQAPAAAGDRAAAPVVRYEISPGTRYRLGAIALGDLDKTGADAPALRASMQIAQGDPLSADAVAAAGEKLAAALGDRGYAFAQVGQPALTIDHARAEGDLSLPVTPGGKYRFGGMTSSDPRFLSARHVQRIARFRPGAPYRRDEVDDLRRAILATGLVSSLSVTPRAVRPPVGDTLGEVALDVTMARAPARTVSGAVGYDTGEGFRLEAAWEHRNLFPPEGMLRLRGVAGTNEQLAGVTFRRSNLGGRDRVLTLDLYAQNATLSAYAARKLAFAGTLERQTTLIFQKPWSWSAGVGVEDSAEREGVPSGVTTGRTNYITVSLPLRATFDRSDNWLDPQRGYRIGWRVSPEVAWARGQTEPYLETQLDASTYAPLGKRVVLASRFRLGSIVGTALENIAPSHRLYAGGGGSIRGYGYELVGPRNALGEPMGGRSLYEASFEARVRTPWLGGAFSLAPFLDMGGAETGTFPHFDDPRFGAGLGLRYQTNFGPIRLDIGTPLNPHPGDSRITVFVALGQAF